MGMVLRWKTFNYMLEIDILQITHKFFVGALRGYFSGFVCPSVQMTKYMPAPVYSPSSGYSNTSTFLIQFWARMAAGPPIEPR